VLSRITVNNIKILREFALDLDSLTVLVGPNACGKSSVLQAIGYLCAIRDTAPQEVFVERNALEHVKTQGVEGPMALGWRASGVDYRWQVDDSAVGQDPTAFSNTRLQRFERESGEWMDISEDGDASRAMRQTIGAPDLWSQPLRDGLSESDRSGIPTAMAINFEFDRLAAPSIMPVGEASIAPDGSGLASALAQLALEHRSCFDRIKESMVQVIPAIRDIRIRSVRESRPVADFQRDPGFKGEVSYSRRARFEDTEIDVPAHELIFDARSGARGIPAHAMSDGTLRLLGLLTVVFGPAPPRLILLDNVERGLHPRALYEVVELLRGAQRQEPELQIVAATQSADLLDYVDAEQIRLLWLGDDGYTRCVRMTDHPSYNEWKALMTPSELWAEIDRVQHPPRAEDA
jgi:predicted ATPase